MSRPFYITSYIENKFIPSLPSNTLIMEIPVYSSGKDGKPDSWFLFDSYKRKRNPVTKVQEPVPEMSHISPQMYKILHKNA